MKKISFKNRYNELISLEQIDDNKVIMTGFDNSMMRYSWGENGYKSIDPSGGPFIETGYNLKYYFDVKKDMFINDLSYNGNQITFFIDEVDKTNYKNPIDQG
jgi:hypothetical protein